MTYLDAASSEPLHPAAREVLLEAYDEGWADPARLYREARRARLLLDNAREVVAAAVGARSDEVVFTGSGTQACHLGVLGALAGRRRGQPDEWLVTSAVEHSAVLQAGAWHERQGASLVTVGVDRAGVVDLDELRDGLAGAEGRPAVVAVQAANHEVGTVQPVEEIAEVAASAGAPLVVDAAQLVPWQAPPSGWAVLAASAHKWGGPAGVGVLAVRRRARFRSVLPEDERGSGLVPGFENVPGALAAAAALRARRDEAADLDVRLRPLVDRIRREVPAVVPDVEVVGHATQRLPHLVTFSCLYVDGEALLSALDRAGFAVSSGSSCTSSTLRPSHVLEAMGVLTHGNVRVSLSRTTTEADVDRFLEVLPGVVSEVRAQLGAQRL